MIIREDGRGWRKGPVDAERKDNFVDQILYSRRSKNSKNVIEIKIETTWKIVNV